MLKQKALSSVRLYCQGYWWDLQMAHQETKRVPSALLGVLPSD